MAILLLLVLALLQGLTEFLPVSSSGHLVLAAELGDLSLAGRSREALFVLLHGASLLALLVGFRSDILAMVRRPMRGRALAAMLLGSLPAAGGGLALRAWGGEGIFDSVLLAGLGWLLTAALLASSRGRGAAGWSLDGNAPLPWGRILLVGCAQAVALLPGVSRAGTTLVAALLLGADRRGAFQLAMLLGIPTIGGAFMLDVGALPALSEAAGPVPLALAFAVAFGASLLAFGWLRSVVDRAQVHRFAPYCLVLGVGALIYAGVSLLR